MRKGVLMSSRLPLAGIRVVEFGGYIAGPYCTSLLGSLGAEVIKIERPGSGDDFRRNLGTKSPYFVQYNSGKKSLSIDLKDPEGVDVIRSLLPDVDVLVENLRPGKLDQLGLGYEDCRRMNPRLVYASITGFGEGGARAHAPAYDTIGQAFSGLYSILSDSGQPQLSGTALADLFTAVSAATGILASVVRVERTGEGQHLQTSIAEALTALTIDAFSQAHEDGDVVEPSRTSRHPQAQNFCVQASDGLSLAIHLSSSESFWARLCRALGRPELVQDARFAGYPERVANYPLLEDIVTEAVGAYPRSHWLRRFSEFDVPHSEVHTISSWLDDPQVKWLDLLESHAVLPLVRVPWRFDGVRPDRSTVTPAVGQDSVDFASEVVGAERVEALMSRGTLFAGHQG